jgi:hypothetical protein
MVRSLAISLAVLALAGSFLLALPASAMQKPVVKPASAKKPVKPKPPPLESNAGLDRVLPSEQFFGAAAMGYAAAEQIPQTCSKVFCYCGCDVTDGHRNLLDCFTNPHGADCHLCQEEALMALRLRKGGQPIGEIQRQIDFSYDRQYRFSDPSPALKRYKATRQYGLY